MVDAVLVTIGLVLINVFLVYKYMTWHFNVWRKLGLSGPRPSVPFGNFGKTLRGKQNYVYNIDDIYNEYKKSHRAIAVFMTREPEIMVLDPKLAHDVMVRNFRKFHDGAQSLWILDKKADQVAHGNPFLATGDDWKAKRSDVMAGLTANKLNLAYPIWKSAAQKLHNYVEERVAETGAAVIETKNLAYRFTTDIMGDFLWGTDAGALSDGGASNALLEMEQKMIGETFQAVNLLTALTAAPFFKRFINYRLFPEVTDRFFTKLTKDALEARRGDSAKGSRADYLNHIVHLQEKKGTTLEAAVGHVVTVMLDGYETSANAIYHTLFFLAKHPQVQDKLRAEILAHLDSDGFIAFDTLNSLPYLDQCVHETLRVITPITVYKRLCTEPTELELGGGRTIPIPVGTTLTIPIFSFHHDADYFPQPYEFNPERFEGGANVELTKQGIFMPFGEGPRICIGMRAGLFEVKTALVEILRHYSVRRCSRTLEGARPDSNTFILAIDGDIWLKYERLR